MTQVSYKRVPKPIPWGAYKDVTPAKVNPKFKKGEILGSPYKNRAEADAAGVRNVAWEKKMSGVGYIANQRRGLHK
ncbi:MAG: hypothetical protein Q7S52_05390 [bacterium]|nr:hypothetical protein [bacterium]